jgi:hypothetical protein
MPDRGSLTLSDVKTPTLTVVCSPCSRLERYDVQRLMAQHSDAKLTDLLQTLADCQKARSASIHDRCKAVFERLVVR